MMFSLSAAKAVLYPTGVYHPASGLRGLLNSFAEPVVCSKLKLITMSPKYQQLSPGVSPLVCVFW